MSAFSALASWTVKRKRLLAGVVSVAVTPSLAAAGRAPTEAAAVTARSPAASRRQPIDRTYTGQPALVPRAMSLRRPTRLRIR